MLSDSLRPILVGLLPSAEASRYVQGEPMRVRYAKLPSELQNRCLALYNLKLQSAKQEARDADLLGARDLKLVLQKPLRVIDFEYTKPDGSVLRM
jgi:hypothetical protein